MTGLAARGIPLGTARAGIELTVLVAGWLLGGSVGVGTDRVRARDRADWCIARCRGSRSGKRLEEARVARRLLAPSRARP